MKILNKITWFTALLLIVLIQLIFAPLSQKVYAATSPAMGSLSGYSILGGAAVTNTGTTTTNGAVGVSPGTSIGGGISAGGGIHPNDASAITAQADNLTLFGALDQACDHSYGAQDLTLISPLTPGVYCSSSSFSLSGNLNLTGSGVWIFKTVSTLITSSASSVTGGDPCNVWWRVGTSVTLGTTTSFMGSILALNGVNSMNTGATLNGRLFAQPAGTVTLDNNTITGPTCASSTPTPTPAPGSTPTPTPIPESSNSSSDTSTTTTPGVNVCPDIVCVTPIVIESKRVDENNIYMSWGPYAGISTFIIQYGPENGKWLYNTKVTGFSTTINALPANQPIWVMISPTNDCSIGQCGISKLVGGPSLPNTGLAPHQDKMPWYIQVEISAGILVSLILIQRKYRFYSKHETSR